MVVGMNGKPVTSLDSASAPSPLGGSVVIITIGITTIAVILYCFCRIYSVIVRENEVVSAADDGEGGSQVMDDWDDDYDEEERAYEKKKKKSKKKKHQIADYD